MLTEFANGIRDNAVIIVIVLLFWGVWYLEKIKKNTDAIHYMMHREFKQRFGLED
jgi:hypothetical protein